MTEPETQKLRTMKMSSTSDDNDTGSMGFEPEKVPGVTKEGGSGDGCCAKKVCIPLVILIIIVVTLAAVFLTLYFDMKKRKPPLYRYSFDDVFGDKFNAKEYKVDWISDTEYLRNVGGDVLMHSVQTDSSEMLLSRYTLVSLNGSRYTLSPDRKYFLIACNARRLYRYSVYADYFVHEIANNQSFKLSGIDEQIRYAGWSTVGNAVVYVYKNDIYYKTTVTAVSSRITTNGNIPVEDKDNDRPYYNGIPDWVYEEEIFGRDNTIWFSEDGKYMAYASFDEKDVRYFRWPTYEDIADSYGKINILAYPKPGQINPRVLMNVYNVKDRKGPYPLNPPSQVLDDPGYYLAQATWTDEDSINVQWVNRKQTLSVVVRYSAFTGYEEVKFVDDQNLLRNRWVYEGYPEGVYPKDKDFYLTRMPVLQTALGGDYIHVVKIPLNADRTSMVDDITKGEFEVTKFWFDEKKDLVYFISTEQGPSQRHLYSVNVDGRGTKCLTCKIPLYTSGQCTYFDADFSLEKSYYVLYCKGPGLPQTFMHNVETGEVKVLEDNSKLRAQIKKTDMPIIRNFTIRVENDLDIHGREILPPDFDEDEIEFYAVLFHVYGGPASQSVKDIYKMSFSSYLVSNFDIIVVEIDPRGSGYRGERHKSYVYKRLGQFESHDVIFAGKYIQRRPYVDPTRLAIWGWSYGGYLTSYVLANGTGVFKCGMAVAPVTDWRYYDSIYTERYMGMPTETDNLAGYERASVLPRTKNIRNDSFLLVHGTNDDNVHFQHAAQLVKELVKHQISFRVQFYTDKTHGLLGDATRRHLYWLLSTFTQDCLTH